MTHKGVKFSEDHKALVLWSLQDRKDTHAQEIADKAGSLMVYRVGETSGTEAALMTQQVGDFNLQVALKEQKKLEGVTARLDKGMDAYNQNLKEIVDKDILIANPQKQLGKRPQVERSLVAQIVSSPAHPPSTEPIVEILGTPRSPIYYTHDDLKEEMSKLKVAQVRVEMNFEKS